MNLSKSQLFSPLVLSFSATVLVVGLVLSSFSTVQAQDTVVPGTADSVVTISSRSQSADIELINAEPVRITQMSAVTEPADSVELEQAAVSQVTNMTAGVCLVVNGLLADFCKSYPGDISCNFQ